MVASPSRPPPGSSAWPGARRGIARLARDPRGQRRLLGLGVLVLALASAPWWGGRVAGSVARSKLERSLGLPVRLGGARLGLGTFVFRELSVGDAAAPLAKVGTIEASWLAALGRGQVTVRDVALDLVAGGERDNVKALVARLRGKGAAANANSGGETRDRRLPALRVERAHLRAWDAKHGIRVTTGDIEVAVDPGSSFTVKVKTIDGVWAPGGEDADGPRFGARVLTVAGGLERGVHLAGDPSLALVDGFASPLPNLDLTGVSGTIGPNADEAAAGKGPTPLVIDLHGSYAGSKETLWTARGSVDPRGGEGRVALVAERFTLDRIADVLPPEVLSPGQTAVDGALDVSWAEDAVRFAGDLRLSGLSLMHKALAAEPLQNMSLTLDIRGTAFPSRRRVSLERLQGQLGDLQGRLSGFVELQPGSFTFANGKRLGFLPKIDLALEVPRVPCAKALASFPPALVPKLQGFVLQGFFDANLGVKIDYADLENVALSGKVGIDGCKVLKPAPSVAPVLTGQSIVQTVEVPPAPGKSGTPKVLASGATIEVEDMQFVVGPENPEFAPYAQIAPGLINSILTTEDNGFFKHRGWVSSEFRTALKKNLARGRFHGGASSITMQTVKNLLLTQEKTLSRKLQELFLVWYLEQNVPKERILELYFNAIEFGPRIYGIGAAARHYFGKKPAELTALEGAFFSSILPSPKRRYVQYCHGSLLPQWDRYVRRILAKVHERGRISDEEYTSLANSPFVFDRNEATFTEKQCLDWVKRIVPPKTEPDAPGEVESPGDDEGGDGAAHGPKAAHPAQAQAHRKHAH